MLKPTEEKIWEIKKKDYYASYAEKINKRENGEEALVWVILFCTSVFVIIFGRETVNVMLYILILVIPSLIGVIFYRKKYLSSRDALDEGAYKIRIAVCVGKNKYEDEEECTHSMILACKSYPDKSFDITYEEYEKCKIGDLYYVVIVNANNDMILQFRCDDYKLSKSRKKEIDNELF